ncbi:MAG: hypothetical protein HC873_09110 [Leptolyngbyaceae cyanobacterium SL_1_1]|nr:hypothetical protein [Leptolyngbyaceae cyanobacterium SL_1_1]
MQAASSLVTFDQFVADYPAQANQRYELHRGIIVEMPKPKGKHSKIAGFINGTSVFTDSSRKISR